MKEAKRAYSQKQYQKAIKLFTEYSKENPSDGEPYMLMGYIYESQRDFPRSMAMFRRSVELNLNPKQRKTCYLKIILYYSYHQGWDIVVHYSNKFLKLDPSNKDVNKMRDRAYANRGSDPGNLSFAKAEDSKSKQKKNTEEIEKTKVNREKEKERERELEREKEKAREKSEQASTNEKSQKLTNEEKNWELSLKYFKKEDYVKADKIMQELLNQSPNNENYLYKAGIAKLRLGEYANAIKYFENSKKFTKENNTTLLYYLNLNEGQANQKLGNVNTAIALYKKAYSYNNSPILLPVLTKLYFENSYFNESIKSADQILKTDSKNLEAKMYKSLSLILGGQKKIGYGLLLDFTKKINKLYPDLNTVPEKYHEGLLQTGVFYSNRAKYKLALKYLTVVSSTKSKTTKFNFALGKSYFYTKKYTLAALFLEKIPEVPASNYLLAKYYASQNDLKKTREFLLKATKMKESYWSKVGKDPYFNNLFKVQEFAIFVNSKGLLSSNQNQSQVNITPSSETKQENNNQQTETEVKNTENKIIPKDENNTNLPIIENPIENKSTDEMEKNRTNEN